MEELPGSGAIAVEKLHDASIVGQLFWPKFIHELKNNRVLDQKRGIVVAWNHPMIDIKDPVLKILQIEGIRRKTKIIRDDYPGSGSVTYVIQMNKVKTGARLGGSDELNKIPPALVIKIQQYKLSAHEAQAIVGIYNQAIRINPSLDLDMFISAYVGSRKDPERRDHRLELFKNSEEAPIILWHDMTKFLDSYQGDDWIKNNSQGIESLKDEEEPWLLFIKNILQITDVTAIRETSFNYGWIIEYRLWFALCYGRYHAVFARPQRIRGAYSFLCRYWFAASRVFVCA
jgi:hypothetical protein